MATTYQPTPPLVDEAKKATSSHIMYPQWPTSQPGPAVTAPPSGQRPHARRSDQMVYECYDQERGMPCDPPARAVMQEHKGTRYLPNERFQDRIAEAEATQRWLDDGGTSEQETAFEVQEVGPLMFASP